jgi:hypothetical protein
MQESWKAASKARTQGWGGGVGRGLEGEDCVRRDEAILLCAFVAMNSTIALRSPELVNVEMMKAAYIGCIEN